ncbi:hypothetical protein SEUCBS139899_009639 [Sporothrix eucalyptigena]
MTVAYKPPTPVDVEHLIQELTVDEKILLLAGKNFWETWNIDRLTIPSLKVSDGPNGVRGKEMFDGPTAACFPACVSLAATFNLGLAKKIGNALAEEAETKGAHVLLCPTVCGHRSPLGGRNFEAFSEDPLLTGLLATEYVKGLQESGIGATIKHFAANEQETLRLSVMQTVAERPLREIYLRPFEIVVKKAAPWACMTSYARVNGSGTDSSTKLLQDILRGQWGFQGLIMSDWGSTTTSVDSVNAGLDLEMPGPAVWRTPEIVRKAFDDGRINLKTLNARARAVLNLLVKANRFDDVRTEPVKETAVDRPEHRELIREAGGEGIVLLKNDGVLPLQADLFQSIAIVGPLAKYPTAHGGGSATLNCHYRTSLFDAVTARFPHKNVMYAKGAHVYKIFPELEGGADNCRTKTGQPGWLAEYFHSSDRSGEPFYTNVFPRSSFMTVLDPPSQGHKSVQFSSTYLPKDSGLHYVGFSSLAPAKLFINGELAFDQTEPFMPASDLLMLFNDEPHFRYTFEAGKSYEMVVNLVAPTEPSDEIHILDFQSGIHLGLVSQAEMEADVVGDAVALAKQADLTIVCVGKTEKWETEHADMKSMALPANGSQDRLVAEIAALEGVQTIVVNSTGGPVCTPWINEVDALVQAWYGGQESGNAVLDVLLGDVNPSGRLPMSWPKAMEHCAWFGHFGLDSMVTKAVEYVEGVNVGYRHFDQMWGTEKEVRFPFGYGLSYTTFTIEPVGVEGSLSPESAPGASIAVTVKVTNTGTRQGKAVAQVYICPPISSTTARPPKALVGWAKIHLQPGETQETTVSFERDSLAFWDDAMDCWTVEQGMHDVLVGTSSDPKDLTKTTVGVNIDEAFTFAA